MKLKEFTEMTLSQIWERMKKPFNFAWKTGVIVIAVAMLWCLGGELVDWICDLVDGPSYDVEYVGDLRVHNYADGTCRVYRCGSDRRVTGGLKFVDTYPLDENYTPIKDKNDKWGFLDLKTGEIAIEPVYNRVWDFSEGLAAVVYEDGEVGFIDSTGTVRIPKQRVKSESVDYVFYNGICILEDAQTSLDGAIDVNGRWVLPMEYDAVLSPQGKGLMKVCKDDLWGLYDMNGQEKFPIIYDDIYYDEDFDAVFTKKDGIKQLVTLDGKVIEPFVIDYATPLLFIVEYHPDSLNVTATHPYLVDYEIDGMHGVMDNRNCRIVVPADYDSVELLSEQTIMAALDNMHSEKVVFDLKGNRLP